jgi:hypothetical protein
MAFASSGKAIGAVTQLLHDQLRGRGFEVSVGKPEDAASNNADTRLNLFLYEIAFDGHLRNVSLRDPDPPPLWLVLKYLLTAYDADSSDSIPAHELLGRGLAALQSLSVLRLDTLDATVRAALENSPEPLKLTFDESSVELLSKVMQGTDEKYRLSAAFQVRPVMIVPGQPPVSSLLVGVDYTTAPAATVIGEDGIRIEIIPGPGPRLNHLEPARFETGSTVEVFGTDLGGADIEVVLGDQLLVIQERREDRLLVVVEGPPDGSGQEPIAAGVSISAGELPLIVRRRLTGTRTRSSNLLVAHLLPTLTSAAVAGVDLLLTGVLLGADSDDVMVALNREADGASVRMVDVVTTAADQRARIVSDALANLPSGVYFVILYVNNEQARSSPRVVVP